MQSGRIFRKGPSWYLQFRRAEFRDGKPVRVQAVVKLARYSDTYRSKAAVRELAKPFLLEQSTDSADLSLTLNQFIEDYYFRAPETKALRPSTLKNYRDIYKLRVKSSVGKVTLRDFKTSTAQAFLDSLGSLSRTSGLRTKSFMSAVFSFAMRVDVWVGVNPMLATRARGIATRPTRRVYSLGEVLTMLAKLPEPARTVIALAAFTGLRSGEIRGLRWKDFDGDTLTVARSIWRTHVGVPKTEGSAATVPIIPFLRKMLEQHGAREKHGPEDYIFAGNRKRFAATLDNLTRRVIQPAISSCEVCKKELDAHEKESHEFKPSKTDTLWRGWHAFRRGLGTNLSELGVNVKTIQAILRHSSAEVTRKHYIVIDTSKATAAMQRIEKILNDGPGA
jgi:integrase